MTIRTEAKNESTSQNYCQLGIPIQLAEVPYLLDGYIVSTYKPSAALVIQTIPKEYKMKNQLDDEIDKLLPEMDRVISETLPKDIERLFNDYIFLTLAKATRPYTPLGTKEAYKAIQRSKLLLDLIRKNNNPG